jgi:hypothetical protein
MATGGIFQLITNDGKQDRMLMASALLKQRIDAARAKRVAAGDADSTPTLFDIERTHILFTNAHFKPFAAIGYEYNKVRANAGSPTLGSSVTFSIPQFGDFFHDMVLHVVLNQPTLTGQAGVAASDQSLMRWCAFPGERLIEKVEFNVNGNPLDEYTHDAMNFHREFQVQPNKRLGWDRCVGQQEYEEGWVDQPNWVNSGVASSAVGHRIRTQTTSGNQTPTKQKTEQLELFIPLLFWCNQDPRLSVPSVAIPYGQRFITFSLASQAKLVGTFPRGANLGSFGNTSGGTLTTVDLVDTIELYINNIFVNPEVHNIFIKRIGFTLIRVHRLQITNTTSSSAEVLLQQLKWPIEALFVGMRIKNYHTGTSAEVNENLDKWHKFSQVSDASRSSQGWSVSRATTAGSNALITGLFAGVTAFTFNAFAANTTLTATVTGVAIGDSLKVDDVLSFTVGAPAIAYSLTVASVSATGLVFTFKDAPVAVLGVVDLVAAGSTDHSITRATSVEQTNTVQVCGPTLDRLTIKAHGIAIYNDFPSKFYNAYTPFHYGGPNIASPQDCGALMVTFCLYPGTYQPSGHINVSRAREFYLGYTSSVINTTTEGSLVVLASAINFLLISDGSAVLRYST